MLSVFSKSEFSENKVPGTVMTSPSLLYYITDRSQFAGGESDRTRALIAKVSEAASAGVDYIQLREKNLSARDLEKLARDAVVAVRENSPSTRVLINARTDVALAAGADGVHLRSEDVSPADVRDIWSNVGRGTAARITTPIVAVSCHTVNSVQMAAAQSVNFAVFAPVFGKAGLVTAPPAGLALLAQAGRQGIPVLALGGITLENAAVCLQAGAAGIAAIRLFQDNKIKDVVRALRTLRISTADFV
jgi:thiamine-phosphate pyrophosphorylase